MTTAKSFEDFTGPQLSFVLSALTGKKVGRINSLASAHARVATAVKAKGLTLARAFNAMQDWRERDVNHDDFGTLAHVFECAAVADAAEQAPAKAAKPESAARRMERERKEAVARKKADKAAAKAAAPAKAPKADRKAKVATHAPGSQRAAIQASSTKISRRAPEIISDDDAAAIAARTTLPLLKITSAANAGMYQPKINYLLSLAAGGRRSDIEAFPIKGVNTYAKKLRQYRATLLARLDGDQVTG